MSALRHSASAVRMSDGMSDSVARYSVGCLLDVTASASVVKMSDGMSESVARYSAGCLLAVTAPV